MSIKENVDYIKNELSNEEKFLENFVRTERFFKKYKKLIFTVVIAAVVGLIIYVTKNSLDESNRYQSNLLLNSYIESADEKVLASLKDKNKKLYEVALFLQSRKDNTPVEISLPFLKELAQFEAAKISGNNEELNNLTMKNDFLLKEFALFNKALIFANEGKYQEAKDSLNQIPKDSKTFELASLLNHYLVTK